MKSDLRQKLLAKQRGFSVEETKTKSAAISERLRQVLKNETGIWLGYQKISPEPEIAWVQVAPHINWAFPLSSDEGRMTAVAGAKHFKKSQLGVQEPVGGQAVSADELSGVVAPAVAFDKNGYRLGRGGGYYDRYLTEFKNKKVGLCFEEVLQEQLPREQHDVQFDIIITENKTYYIQTTQGEQKWN